MTVIREIIRVLAMPESGRDWYAWATIALSHALLGFSLVIWLDALSGWSLWLSQGLVVAGYVAKECRDLLRGGGAWDGVFDVLAVCGGVWMVAAPLKASLTVWAVVLFGVIVRSLRLR